jgi:UDP-N-acetylmuramyl pentapeptide phosphotransferase/UDP-N-acetylglucosamine-1-phosphate transferase
VAVVALSPSPAPSSTWLIAGSALAFGLLGLLDDIRGGLPARGRLAVQFLIAFAIAGGIEGGAGSSTWVRAAMLPLVIVGIVGFVNAFNFMDGMNGVAATACILVGSTNLFIGHQHHLGVLVVGGEALLVGALGFLPWNFPKAKIFLGDVGSYFLGALISGLGLYASTHGVRVDEVVAPVALFLTDVAVTIVRRFRRGEDLLEAHREHIYQRLAALGIRHEVVVGILVLGAIMQSAACIARPSTFMGVVLGDGLAIVVSVAYVALPALLRSPRDLTGRGSSSR